jgi:hypothetical protein
MLAHPEVTSLIRMRGSLTAQRRSCHDAGMNLADFEASLAQPQAPAGLTPPLLALWHAGRDEWDTAHGIAQQQEGEPRHDWVHAYLHRVEGDLGNASYWYRRAGKMRPSGDLREEWRQIVRAMLG